MRDVYQVIREKEGEILRVHQEIEAIRAILPLLQDDSDETSDGLPRFSPLAVNHD